MATIYLKAIVRRCYFGVDFIFFELGFTVQQYTIENRVGSYENVKYSKPLNKEFLNTLRSFFS